jgi:type II secretory pathway pseudopilin PulG
MNNHVTWTRRVFFGITGYISIASVIVTLVILFFLTYVILPNLLIMIQQSKASHTAADMRAIGTAFAYYHLDYDHYPVSPNSLTTLFSIVSYSAPDTSDLTTKDGWGREFHYHSENGTTYTLSSYGKGGKKGGSGYGSDIIYSNGQFVAPARYR